MNYEQYDIHLISGCDWHKLHNSCLSYNNVETCRCYHGFYSISVFPIQVILQIDMEKLVLKENAANYQNEQDYPRKILYIERILVHREHPYCNLAV